MHISNQHKAMFASWVRVFLTGCLTVMATGELNPRNIVTAGLLAYVPVLLRWLNPNDPAYGRTR